MRGAWFFQEGAGSQISNLVTGNLATLTNTQWSGSPRGSALQFNEASAEIVAPWWDIPAIGVPITIMVYFAPTLTTLTSTGGGGAMLAERSPVNTTWQLFFEYTGSSVLRWRGNGFGTRMSIASSATGMVADEWYWLTVVDDGVNVAFYRDGTLLVSGAGLDTAPVANQGDIHFGSYDSSSYWFGGRLGAALLFNDALPVDQVADIAASPGTLFLAPTWRRYTVPLSTQTAHPIADITTGTWTATPLYAKIDETVPDDADYIQSALQPTSDVAEVKFGPLTDPATGAGHVLRYRIKKTV